MQKAMYAVFFTIYQPAFQVAMTKGKGITALFYRDKVSKNSSCFLKRQPKNELKYVKLLHDNGTSHKATIVMEFL